MKKKHIIICIVLAVLLFCPVYTGTLKDGGTKSFTALTYKIVSWNRLIEGGETYSKTKIYFIPFNFRSVGDLWYIEKKELKETQSENVSTSNTETTTAAAPAEESTANATEKAKVTTAIPENPTTAVPENNAVYDPLVNVDSGISIAGNAEYKKEYNGLSLSVSLPETVEYGEEFTLIAKVTNNTSENITYTLPTTSHNSHYDIRVKISHENVSFIDRDTFGKAYNCAQGIVTMRPGDSFEQTIHFIPGWTLGGRIELEDNEITMFDIGTYIGTAEFYWDTEEKSDSISLEFPVVIK